MTIGYWLPPVIAVAVFVLVLAFGPEAWAALRRWWRKVWRR